MTAQGQALKVAEVAHLLRVTRNTVESLIRTGRLRAFRVGRVWRISAAAVKELETTGRRETTR